MSSSAEKEKARLDVIPRPSKRVDSHAARVKNARVRAPVRDPRTESDDDVLARGSRAGPARDAASCRRGGGGAPPLAGLAPPRDAHFDQQPRCPLQGAGQVRTRAATVPRSGFNKQVFVPLLAAIKDMYYERFRGRNSSDKGAAGSSS